MRKGAMSKEDSMSGGERRLAAQDVRHLGGSSKTQQDKV